MTRPIETAASYGDLGWAVLPLCGVGHTCQTPGKVPVDLATGRHLSRWQQRGVPTLDEIDRWASSPLAPRANLGCLTGRVSSVVALDIDGPGGEALLRRCAQGDLPPTWEYRTGGGRRLIYRYAEGLRSLKLAGDGEHEGLEVLSDGRQMVIPPSHHKTGPDYAWVAGRDPWSFGDVSPCPPWVRELAKPQGKRSTEDWIALLNTPTSKGGRHPSLVSLAASLAGHHLDPEVIFALLQAWNEVRCQPPKSSTEVAQIVRWATQDQAPSTPRALTETPQEVAKRLGCSMEAARHILAQGAVSA